MKVEQVSISLKRTIPLEPYESISVGGSIICQPQPEEDRKQLYEKLYRELEEFINGKLREEKERRWRIKKEK